VIDPKSVPVRRIKWRGARRIIGSSFPMIDLFDDIADPEDWPLLIAAEQKTNPRLMETIGNLDLVPRERRVGGSGASYLMAPFTHISTDRPSRYSKGRYGVLYIAEKFETALFETIYHHALLMLRTHELPGWASQFRELILDIEAPLHDLRGEDPNFVEALAPNNYAESQRLAEALRTNGSEGIVYPSQRHHTGQCAGLFHPNNATLPIQGRHFDYHWNGAKVDFYRVSGTTEVWRVAE
jgi:RES domain